LGLIFQFSGARLSGTPGKGEVLCPHIGEQMPRNRINFEKIRASLDTTCTACGFAISPADVQRVDFEHIRCSNCGKDFVPDKKES
jgi:hypothetical protein